MLKGYKTVLFNVLMFLVFILQQVEIFDFVKQFCELFGCDQEKAKFILGASVFIINLWLRFKTTTPVFEKN